MLQRLAANGAKTIIVESPDRFARDLAVQLAGHDMLKELGIAIIPASSPNFFTEDTPTAVLVRQVLGAIAQFEKASTVAKLAAARKRKREREGRCEGRKPLSVTRPEIVALARKLRRRRPKGGQLSLRSSGFSMTACTSSSTCFLVQSCWSERIDSSRNIQLCDHARAAS
jgi:hypothetical protein